MKIKIRSGKKRTSISAVSKLIFACAGGLLLFWYVQGWRVGVQMMAILLFAGTIWQICANRKKILVWIRGHYIRRQRDVILRCLASARTDEHTRGEFIRFIRQYPSTFQDRDNLNGHFTGSMLVFNGDLTKVLLTKHKKLQKWLQLGGHWDDISESIFEAALREMFEEGFGNEKIPYRLLLTEAVDLDKHSVGNHDHYDVCFACAVLDESLAKCSSESDEVSWVAVDHILQNQEIYGPRLRRMIITTLNMSIEKSQAI